MQAIRRKTVFISGSAYEYGRFGEDGIDFIRELSAALLKNGFRIISGFGAGVGNFVVEGALQEIYTSPDQKLTEQLKVYPFPLRTKLLTEIQQNYRNDMIALAGTAIFLFGNKLEDISIREADGMRTEFEIARSQNALLIPVGASGYISQQLWQNMLDSYDDYFSTREQLTLYEQLGNPEATPQNLIDTILQIAMQPQLIHEESIHQL